VAEEYALDRIEGKVVNGQELARQDWLDVLATLTQMNAEINGLMERVKLSSSKRGSRRRRNVRDGERGGEPDGEQPRVT